MAHAQNEINSEIIGINSVSPTTIDLNVAVLAISMYQCLPLSKIRSHIPEIQGVRSSACLRLLFILNVNHRSAIRPLARLMHSNTDSTTKNMYYLESLGLVRRIGKPRLIIPFQAYKIDKGWIITQAGISVLRDVLV